MNNNIKYFAVCSLVAAFAAGVTPLYAQNVRQQQPRSPSYVPFEGTEFDTTSQRASDQNGTGRQLRRTQQGDRGSQVPGRQEATSERARTDDPRSRDNAEIQIDPTTGRLIEASRFPDYRPPEDRAVFNEPPAGGDPLLFQIEDIEPLTTDRRPARLARIEPFDPVGIKLGTFVLFPEGEVRLRGTDNVFLSPGAVDDKAVDLVGELRLVSNWSAHALELRGTIDSSHHDENTTEDTLSALAELRGRIDVSRKTNIQGLLSHEIGQESRIGVDANRLSERAEFTLDRASLTLNHRFNRLSLQLRGSVTETDFGAVGDVTNDDRDETETQQAVRATWEFKPTLSVFAEAEFTQTNNDVANAADGINRSAHQDSYRVGLDFGSTGRIIRGEVSAGYGQLRPEDGRLADTDAFLFDANVTWRPTELTSLLFSGSTELSTSINALTSGVVTRAIGAEVRHAFRRYVIASAGITYTDLDYQTSTLEESDVTTFVQGEYFANPGLIFTTRFERTDFDTSDANGDFTANTVWAGVRMRR